MWGTALRVPVFKRLLDGANAQAKQPEKHKIDSLRRFTHKRLRLI